MTWNDHDVDVGHRFESKPPPASAFVDLKPTNLLGFLYTCICSTITGCAVCLATSETVAVWIVGQLLLAIALVQWFVLLHEAGHKTLFRSNRLNRLVGHIASLFALIPFGCWKLVHGRHHYWTGWQDLDATTEPLVPRKLSGAERLVVNVSWKLWLPLFSTMYRVNNFWNVLRLSRLFPSRAHRWRILRGVSFQLAAYGVLVALVGPLRLVQLVGLGIFISLVIQDPLILSQHTHVPLNLSRGKEVSPFRPIEQQVFTRSLKFPRWFSSVILLNFDAHELHHMYTSVPGYYLHKINYAPSNCVEWWRWVVRAKRIPAEVFLFQNRNTSGLEI